MNARRIALIALLSLGVVGGYASGIRGLMHHRGAACHEWRE
jgi:hypothetical protein